MGVGLHERGVDKRECSRTDVDSWEVGGQDVESVTGAEVGRKELCAEFVKGLVEGADSQLELKSAVSVEGVRSKVELPEMLLLGDDTHAKRKTIERHP